MRRIGAGRPRPSAMEKFLILPFPRSPSVSVLALGGARGRFCLARRGEAFLGPDFGSLEETRRLARYRESLLAALRALSFRPEIVAFDLHPGYPSARLAPQLVAERFPSSALRAVQHHHAHVAAVLAERGEDGPTVGLAWDGTGYGGDGTVWGGETLVVGPNGWRRAGHLDPVPLPGGEKASTEPWRMALAYLHRLRGPSLFRLGIPFVRRLDRRAARLLVAALERGINAPLSSSMGRLFDAVAALLGLSGDGGPASAARALEKAGARLGQPAYPFALEREEVPFRVDCRPLVAALVADLRRGARRSVVAARFHRTAIAIGAASAAAAGQGRRRRVVLSGGVFGNRILREGLSERLQSEGWRVILPNRIPVHDGGLALGQAWVVSRSLTRSAGNEGRSPQSKNHNLQIPISKQNPIRCVSPSPCGSSRSREPRPPSRSPA